MGTGLLFWVTDSKSKASSLESRLRLSSRLPRLEQSLTSGETTSSSLKILGKEWTEFKH